MAGAFGPLAVAGAAVAPALVEPQAAGAVAAALSARVPVVLRPGGTVPTREPAARPAGVPATPAAASSVGRRAAAAAWAVPPAAARPWSRPSRGRGAS